jgi:uncharacterized membrane protein
MEQSHQPLDQPPAPKQTSTGLEPNLAGALSYLCGLLTGLIFFLMEKDNKFVRFHAMQSILLSAGFFILYMVFMVLGAIPVLGWLFYILLIPIGIAAFVLWIMLMVKAYQGERFRLPVVGEMAEKYI